MSRLYLDAAAVLGPSLDGMRKKGQPPSLKSRMFAKDVKNKRMTHLLVSETLKHLALLEEVLAKANLSIEHDLESPNTALAMILLYELLFGAGKIRGGGALKRNIIAYESKLRDALAFTLKRKPGLLPATDTQAMQHPRYCRVNKLKCRIVDVQKALNGTSVAEDEHVPGLLVLPPGTDLHDNHLVKDGCILLQDKSSCFPVAALRLAMEGRNLLDMDCIDCCAAPGNKTTQLAAELNPGAKVHAFDKSKPRFELLCQRISLAGCEDRIVPSCGDFLEQSSHDPRFRNVRTILLDPSCSGTGTVSLERQVLEKTPLDEDAERVIKLAEFQLQALCHAMSFEKCELISYSTCSVLYTENEDVVAKALSLHGDSWQLIQALPSWPRRGEFRPSINPHLTELDCAKLVRADQRKGDLTGGFFLALFERKNDGRVTQTEDRAKKKQKTMDDAKPLEIVNQNATPEDRLRRYLKRMSRIRDSATGRWIR